MAINLKLNIDPNLNKITVHDFNNICRTCSQSNDLVSILQNTYLIGMLQTLSNIQIQLNDELPKKICLNCVKDLNKSYSFISKCKATDAAYKQCVNRQRLQHTKLSNDPKYSKNTKDIKHCKENEVIPKSPEEIFIKTEIHETIEEFNDPLSISGEWTQDPLEYQENTNQQTKVEFEGGIMFIRNNQQIQDNTKKRKRKRSPENTSKNVTNNSTKSKSKGKNTKKKVVNVKTESGVINATKENEMKKMKQ